ncbi:MAG: hypothetical protein K2X39_07095, partial [Silvanigrellaceae bacterium]|nr:hypothetical protein [Silvanigrellaceae bacterium]
KPDFWGETCSDEPLHSHLLEVKNSFAQLSIGALSMVFKIDKAISVLINWDYNVQVPWKTLKQNFNFPEPSK